jgi:hypothetical protein
LHTNHTWHAEVYDLFSNSGKRGKPFPQADFVDHYFYFLLVF